MLNISYYVDEQDQQQMWVTKDAENIAMHYGMQARQEEIDEETERGEIENDPINFDQNNQGPFTDHDDSLKGEEGGSDNSSDMSMN